MSNSGPVPNARTQAAAKKVILNDPFDLRTETLLGFLHKVYEGGPRTGHFNKNQTWRELVRIGHFYLRTKESKVQTIPNGDRAKKLTHLAEKLGDARDMTKRAFEDALKMDLMQGWFAGTDLADIGPLAAVRKDPGIGPRIADEINQAIAAISALETAARRAAARLNPKDGPRPGSSVLSAEYIHALAKVFHKSTEVKPNTKEKGPFCQFVWDFLGALDTQHIEYTSMARNVRDAAGLAPSLFEGYDVAGKNSSQFAVVISCIFAFPMSADVVSSRK